MCIKGNVNTIDLQKLGLRLNIPSEIGLLESFKKLKLSKWIEYDMFTIAQYVV